MHVSWKQGRKETIRCSRVSQLEATFYDCEVHQYRAQGGKRSGGSCRDVGSVSASRCAASEPAQPLRVAIQQRTSQERALQEWALQEQEQELQERVLQKGPGRPRQQPRQRRRQRRRRQWSLQRWSIWQRTVRTVWTVPSRGNCTAARIQQSWSRWEVATRSAAWQRISVAR